MSRYYIEVGGGLGDLAFQYFRQREFAQLAAVKAHHPDYFIRVINRNVNSSTADFFKFNPFINDHRLVPFSETPIGDRECEPLEVPFNYTECPAPAVYVTEVEHMLIPKGPLVIFHPQTWDRGRSMDEFIPPRDVIRAIEAYGFTPVLVGGHCDRMDTHLHYSPPNIPGCPSLYGTSCRVAIHAITFAKAVIGAHSFASCTADALNIPFRAYVSDELEVIWKKDTRVWHPAMGDVMEDLLSFLKSLTP